MKNIFNFRVFLITSLIAVPLFASAADLASGFNDLGNLADNIAKGLLKSIGTLLATAAMAALFFGLVQYIWGAREGDSTKISKGNQFILWSLVALFVMFSVWGIVTYAQKIFGIQGNNKIIIPTFEFQKAGSTQVGDPNIPPAPGSSNPNIGTPGIPPAPGSSTKLPSGSVCNTPDQCASGLCQEVGTTLTCR